MAQHRRVNSSGQDSAVHILTRENTWFERGVKDSIHVKLEWEQRMRPSTLPVTHRQYSTEFLASSQLNNHLHLDSPSLSNQHEGRLSQVALTTLKLRAHTCP